MRVVDALAFCLVALSPVLAGVPACGSTGDDSAFNNGTGPFDAGGEVGDAPVLSDGALVCSPSCAPDQTCSVTGGCIPKGTCAADGDCPEPATVCDLAATKKCIPGSKCGAVNALAEPIPPNLLIVLDRSCSMTDLVAGVKKWQIAVNALKKLTTSYGGKIRFGLTLFPDTTGQSCAQDAIPIPVGPGKEATIQTLLTSSLAVADPYYPNGPCVTNIDTAIQQAATEPAFLDTTRKSYALLLTDGKQAGCSLGGGDTGTTTAITNLSANAHVPTFVVGFGSGVDAAQMTIFANAGGVPSAGSTKYYNAADQVSLDAALKTIASMTLGCELVLGKTPPDPSKVYVFFDGTTQVTRDPTHASGWDYDPVANKVTIYGTQCSDLKAGKVASVDVVFGCPEPVAK